MVCRRSLLVADISSANFYWACARFMPTFLIDETGTVANNRELRHMLRAGATRDVLAVRTGDKLHSFGPKVISWLEPPDDTALNTRCIQIPMFESRDNTLIGTDSPEMQQEAAHLRAQSLRFRFENRKTVNSVPVQGDECLRPRTRDLLRAITSVSPKEQCRSNYLFDFFEADQVVPSEPLSPEQNAVLQLLFGLVHGPLEECSFYISKLTYQANRSLRKNRERLRLKPRRVGAVLTSLGFTHRRRTNSGWSLSLDKTETERVHQLIARYGLERLDGLQTERSERECGLCKSLGLDGIDPNPNSPRAVITKGKPRVG
jgi:hypothetical protein